VAIAALAIYTVLEGSGSEDGVSEAGTRSAGSALGRLAPPELSWLCTQLPAICDAERQIGIAPHGPRVAIAVLSCLVVAPLSYFWYCRTRNIVQNLTTNEQYNRARYPHFKRSNGLFVNPFDRGVLSNCHFYFCAPCNSGGRLDGDQLLLFDVAEQGAVERAEGLTTGRTVVKPI
jgi:hypothetical protein